MGHDSHNSGYKAVNRAHTDTAAYRFVFRIPHNQQERGVERGSVRRSSLKGRERDIVNHTNIRTVSKATLGTLLRDGVERIITGFCERIDTILN